MEQLTCFRSQQTTIIQKEINYDYEKLLNAKSIELPPSLEMKCTPKPTYEDEMMFDDVSEEIN